MSNESVKIQEAYEDVAGALLEWRELVESSGWKRLAEIARGQVLARIETNGRSRVSSFEDVFEQEFSKGEVSGIELFLRIPDTAIEQLAEEAKELLERINAPGTDE